MNQKTIKLDIEEGGLNIMDFVHLNHILGEKIVWRLLKNDNSWWAQALRRKLL